MVVKTHKNSEHPKNTAAAEELLTGAEYTTFGAHTEVRGVLQELSVQPHRWTFISAQRLPPDKVANLPTGKSLNVP